MNLQDELESVLRKGIRRHRVPGANAAVIRNGRLAASVAAGVVNLDTGVRTTTDSVFQIGSITKIFTTTLVMQLAEEGLLDIDAPVAGVLPELRFADAQMARTVTSRHFLCHTSGVDGDFFVDTGYGADSTERLVAMATMLPSVFPMGEMMSYCNVGFAILGRAIEVLTNRTYDEALRERIFKPLGMTRAMSLPQDALRYRCAVGHVPDPRRQGEYRVTPALFLTHGQKAAGSTPAMSAPDLLKFAHMHMNGGRGAERILKASSVSAMQRRQVKLLPNASEDSTHLGLGWFMGKWGRTRIIGHNGGTMGQAAALRLAPEHNAAVALLTNGGDADALYYDVFDTAFMKLIKETPPRLANVDERVRVDLGALAGRYENMTTVLNVKTGRGGRVTVTTTPKDAERGGLSLANARVGFIDKMTARLNTGDAMADRMTIRFSGVDGGKAQYAQTGLRQLRRTA